MEKNAYILMSETEDNHWWFYGRRTVIEILLESLKLSSNAQILELGAGTGGNLKLLQSFGDVSAMELDDQARELASRKSGLSIMPGKLPNDISFESNRFDVVCLFDVLEHVREDFETLEAIKSLLKPNGRVLITVPAYQWLWSQHDKSLHHFRRYTRTGLKDLFTRAGYKAVKISYFNMMLFPLAVVARLTDRLMAREQSTGINTPPAPINALFKLISWCEAKIFRRISLPYGTSLVTILELEN